MKPDVQAALEELRRQFPNALITSREDGSGGAYVLLDPIDLGPKLSPASAWMGFHIPSTYPYADIYPVFIDGAVRRADGHAFVAPISPGQTFEGRAALQISRRYSNFQAGGQKAALKALKIISFLADI